MFAQNLKASLSAQLARMPVSDTVSITLETNLQSEPAERPESRFNGSGKGEASMGGWAVLAAAAAMPNDNKSMVLEGSSTGKPFAADGTPSWPRNTSLVFAQYEEFPNLMWGVERARDVTQSPKLRGLFGPRAGRARQGLQRHRPGHGKGALHARDHPPGRAYFA
jgi:hypothetical protein